MARSVRFPPRPKPAHHRGTYHQAAMELRRQAYADPSTRCWRCHRTYAEFVVQDKPDKNGKLPHWTAGHVVDGQAGGPMLPECSKCNRHWGAKRGNALSRGNPRRTSRVW